MLTSPCILTFITLTLFRCSGKIRGFPLGTSTKTNYKYVWLGGGLGQLGGFQKAIWSKMFLTVLVMSSTVGRLMFWLSQRGGDITRIPHPEMGIPGDIISDSIYLVLNYILYTTILYYTAYYYTALGKGVTTYTLHPGVVTTEFDRGFRPGVSQFGHIIAAHCMCTKVLTPADGAKTTVTAIFSVKVNKFINSSQFWLQRLFRMLY